MNGRCGQVVLLVILLVLAACGQSPILPPEAEPPVGEQTFGTPEHDFAKVAAIHSSGIYVVGNTYGSLEGPNLGYNDVFVRKYHPEGEMLWANQFGTHLDDFGNGVAVDSSGNAYVVGGTGGSIAGSRGSNDAFIRKYGSAGAVLWTRQFGTSAYDYASGVGADGSGNVYVVGTTSGSLQGSNLGGQDAFVRKYNASGGVAWTRQFGTSAHDGANGVGVDGSGNVYVVGTTSGSLQGSNLGNQDVFIRKYSASGSVVWTRQFGTSAGDWVNGVSVDGGGNAHIVGYTPGSLQESNLGQDDAFIRKYNASGDVAWTRQFGTSAYDWANGVSLDGSGNAYVVGYTSGFLVSGSPGNGDAFIRKYNTSGDTVWTRQFGTSSGESGRGVATLTGDAIYVAGTTNGTLVGMHQGGDDAFLRRLNSSGNHVWTDQ